MTDEEKRAYQRGYNAGQRRKARAISQEKLAARREAFRQRAFLAALPACIAAQGWKRGDKPINSMNDRVGLAWDAADDAMKRFY